MHIRKMAAGTETEHARSVSHCVLHLFLNSKQRTKLETENSDGIYFRSCSSWGMTFPRYVVVALFGATGYSILDRYRTKPHVEYQEDISGI